MEYFLSPEENKWRGNSVKDKQINNFYGALWLIYIIFIYSHVEYSIYIFGQNWSGILYYELSLADRFGSTMLRFFCFSVGTDTVFNMMF